MSKNDDLNSAFLDGELDRGEFDFIGASNLSSDARDTLNNYRMIGDALRNEIDQASFMDVSEAVQKAVEKEPVYTATQSSPEPVRAAKSVSASGGFDISAWFRPLTGMAIAASVAAAMVVGVQTYGPQPDMTRTNIASNAVPGVVAPASVVNPANVVNPVRTAQLPQRLDALLVKTKNNRQDSDVRQRLLDTYLADHSGFASQGSAQGMIPYMRVVSFESE